MVVERASATININALLALSSSQLMLRGQIEHQLNPTQSAESSLFNQLLFRRKEPQNILQQVLQERIILIWDKIKNYSQLCVTLSNEMKKLTHKRSISYRQYQEIYEKSYQQFVEYVIEMQSIETLLNNAENFK